MFVVYPNDVGTSDLALEAAASHDNRNTGPWDLRVWGHPFHIPEPQLLLWSHDSPSYSHNKDILNSHRTQVRAEQRPEQDRQAPSLMELGLWSTTQNPN